MKVYGAIPCDGGWTVGRCSRDYRDMRAVSNVRTFKTFEEADQCAKRVAAGEFDVARPGEYVNMR